MHLLLSDKKKSFEDIELKNIKGILIDFDNTLYEYAPCHERALSAVYGKVNELHQLSLEDFLKYYRQGQKKVKETLGEVAASHSRILYFQNTLEIIFGKTMPRETLELEDTYWSIFSESIAYHDEVIDFLKRAKNYTIKICLVTDLTATVQFRKMVASGSSYLFDYIVTSEEVGKEKPNKDVFDMALKKLGLHANEVIMIGDDRKKDIQGAEACNIKAYQIIYE
jgi:HAD superfamily hydrolase (TIGR01549 family)